MQRKAQYKNQQLLRKVSQDSSTGIDDAHLFLVNGSDSDKNIENDVHQQKPCMHHF